jgi:hypothetical protein
LVQTFKKSGGVKLVICLPFIVHIYI